MVDLLTTYPSLPFSKSSTKMRGSQVYNSPFYCLIKGSRKPSFFRRFWRSGATQKYFPVFFSISAMRVCGRPSSLLQTKISAAQFHSSISQKGIFAGFSNWSRIVGTQYIISTWPCVLCVIIHLARKMKATRCPPRSNCGQTCRAFQRGCLEIISPCLFDIP